MDNNSMSYFSLFRFLYKYSLLLSFLIVNTTWFTYHFVTSYIDAFRSWWNLLLGQFHWSPPSSSHLHPVHIPLSHYENYAQKLQSINWEEERRLEGQWTYRFYLIIGQVKWKNFDNVQQYRINLQPSLALSSPH